MKKYAPYALFALVILLLFWLGFRWYTMRNQAKLSSTQLGEGVSIENLSETEMKKALGTVKDYETVSLDKVSPAVSNVVLTDGEISGLIRYEVVSGKLKLGLVVTASDEKLQPLRAWIRKPGGSDVKSLFSLEQGKGGWVGSAQLDANLLPLEVLISAGNGTPQESLVLKGTIVTTVKSVK